VARLRHIELPGAAGGDPPPDAPAPDPDSADVLVDA
jgi:hypothetical protein